MIESKAFYRKIEHAFAGTENARTRERFAEGFAPRLLEYLGASLGLAAVHLYERRDGGLAKARCWGASRPDIGEELVSRPRRRSASCRGWARPAPAAPACSPWAHSTDR